MEEMDKLVVTVSQHTVFLAEAAIARCSACSKMPGIPLARILDRIGNHSHGSVEYILPVLGRCPACQSSLDEHSIVIPKRLD